MHQAAAVAMGAGELALMLACALPISTSAALLLFSLSLPVLSLFSLLLSAPVDVEPSESPPRVNFGGARHRGISQTTPVNDLSVKPPFCHFRQGLPDRSRARRPALIAPWFALGPSLCAPEAVAVVPFLDVAFGSMDPSSSRGLFFGPGFPRTFGVRSAPSPAAAELRLPPFFLTTSVGGSMAVGPPAAFGTGVFEADSDTFSPGDEVEVGAVMVFDVDDASSLMAAGLGDPLGANGRRALGDRLSFTISVFGDLPLRALLPFGVEDCFVILVDVL